jgi:hypothetical protein
VKKSNLRARIEAELKDAAEAKDHVRACTLRLMIAAIRDRDISRHVDDGSGRLGDSEVLDLLARMVEQRKRSILDYEQAGQLELAEREREEKRVIEGFLPKPFSEDETDAAVRDAIAETKASSIRDLGKVMGLLKKRYPGRIDFGEAGARVKQALG